MTAFQDLMARLGNLEEKVSVELQNLSIDEISGVDSSANGIEGWAIMKSLGMSPDALAAANARLDEVEKALKRTKPNSPLLDPDDGAPLAPYDSSGKDPGTPSFTQNADDGAPLGRWGLPVRGDSHTDPALTGNVAVDLTSPLAIPALAQRYGGPGLPNLKPHEAASMALHPMTHPDVKRVLRRRANPGR